jgi:hypothetical protein
MSNRILKAIRGNLVAWLALFVALGGTSLAASRYVINSTGQINPKVLRKLEGRASGARTGPTGPAGSQGPRGAEGAKGAQGARGTEGAEGLEGLEGPEGRSALSSLPSGQTESGDFGIRITPNVNTSGQIDDSVTFPIPLAARIPSTNFAVTTTGAPVAHCPGPGHAERGYLCIYSAQAAGVTGPAVLDMEEAAPQAGSGRFGFDMAFTVTAANAYDIGTYTVTAP